MKVQCPTEKTKRKKVKVRAKGLSPHLLPVVPGLINGNSVKRNIFSRTTVR